jgi:DNA invertase Pin-like site-specific DNA recombinase
MSVAAIYARKSTEQAVTDEEKSVSRQIHLARACARKHGFEVPAEHTYVDDAISGAEFDRRPALVRLLNALKPSPPFAAVFMCDADRLGREQFQTTAILRDLSLAGVRVFEYKQGGREIKLDSPTDKFMVSVANFASELERVKASQRTRDALHRKAERGHVVGGIVFGYQNVPVAADDGKRSHVVRSVREDEATVVRRIFEMAAAGIGLRKIAITLNDEGVRSPGWRHDRTRSWVPSTVRSIIFNALYKGDQVWGRTRKRDEWGRRKESAQAPNEWVATHVEDARIISDELWRSAHEAMTTRRKEYAAVRETPRAGDAKHLLSGFIACGACGGPVVKTTHGRAPVYRCWNNWNRGIKSCVNSLKVNMHTADETVLRLIERCLLDPQVVEAAIEAAVHELRAIARTQISEARRLLRQVLVGRLAFTPVERPPDMPQRKGPGRRARLICEVSGVVSLDGVFADAIRGGTEVAPTGRDRTCRIQVRDFIVR